WSSDVCSSDLELNGQALAHLILIAPTAWHGLVHPDGETATSLAAAATGTPYILSAQSGTAIETLAALPEPPLLWFQLYAQRRREDTLALATRALQAGARSEEHTSELQSRENLVCRLLLEKKKKTNQKTHKSTS